MCGTGPERLQPFFSAGKSSLPQEDADVKIRVLLAWSTRYMAAVIGDEFCYYFGSWITLNPK
jgi:membrane protein DedA with SNARE-associated domain